MVPGKVLSSIMETALDRVRETPRRAALFAAVLAFSALYPGGMAVAQITPRTVVEAFYGTLLDVMKNGRALGFQGRFDRIRPAFEKAFNAPLMTRVVVGTAWNDTPPALQDRAIDAFTRYSVANYAANFKDYSGEGLQVQGERPSQAGTIVETQIVPTDDKPTGINFLLRPTDGGGWKIADVFLDRTISELATRRSDFARTIRDEGVQGLITRLDAKTRDIAAAARQ